MEKNKLKNAGLYLLISFMFFLSACSSVINPDKTVESSSTPSHLVFPTETKPAHPSQTVTSSPFPTLSPTFTSTPTVTPSPTPPVDGYPWLAFVARDDKDQPYLAVGNLTQNKYYYLTSLQHSGRTLHHTPYGAFSINWSPDGKYIFYSDGSDDGLRVNSFETITGVTRVLRELPTALDINRIKWSPSSSSLFYELLFFQSVQDSRWIINQATGSQSLFDKEFLPYVGWSANGEHLYYLARTGYFIDYDIKNQSRSGINSINISKPIQVGDSIITIGRNIINSCQFYYQLDSFIIQTLVIRDENQVTHPMGVIVLPKDGSPGRLVYESDNIYGKDDRIYPETFRNIYVSPTGNWIYLGDSKPYGTYLVNLNNAQKIKISPSPKLFLNWSPDEQFFAALSGESGHLNITIYKNATGKKVASYSVPENLFPVFQTTNLSNSTPFYETLSLFWTTSTSDNEISLLKTFDHLIDLSEPIPEFVLDDLPKNGHSLALNRFLDEFELIEEVKVSKTINSKVVPLGAGRAYLALLQYSPGSWLSANLDNNLERFHGYAATDITIMSSVIYPHPHGTYYLTENQYLNLFGDYRPSPNQWFYILAAVDPNFRQYRLWVFDAKDPSKFLRYPGYHFGSLVGAQWENFKLEVDSGSVFLESIDVFSIKGFK